MATYEPRTLRVGDFVVRSMEPPSEWIGYVAKISDDGMIYVQWPFAPMLIAYYPPELIRIIPATPEQVAALKDGAE